MLESKIGRALLWGSALALSLSSMAQAQRTSYGRQVSIPEGTVLKAELNDRLSSVDSRPGDRFTGIVRSDSDGAGLPAGTEVIGQVTSVRRASDQQPGTVDVAIRSVKLPDGRSIPITASLTSLDSNSVRRTASGRLESRKSSNNNTKFIGYGAGAGALIGVLSKGNLLTSALLGAAAGYLYGQLNKDKDNNGQYSEVDLKPGTEFGVRVDRDTVASVPNDRSGRYNGSYPGGYNGSSSGYSRSGYNDGNTRTNGRQTGYNNGNNDIRVLVNDRDVRFGQDRPFMSAGRVMVPLAAVLDSAGYSYDYDSRAHEVTVNGDRGDTHLVIGDNYATTDGRRMRLDVPAQRIDGVIFVPSQFLENAIDVRSDWDADQRVLRLTTRTRASLPGDNSRAR